MSHIWNKKINKMTQTAGYSPSQLVSFAEELYTTRNNERRKEIMRVMPSELTTPEEASVYISLLSQVTNVYSQQYILSLLTNSLKKHTSTLLLVSVKIQEAVLVLIKGQNIPKFIQRTVYSLFSLTVVLSWKDVSTHQQFLALIQALLEQNQILQTTIAVNIIFYVLDVCIGNMRQRY